MMNFFGQGRRERTRIERLENERLPRTTNGAFAQSAIGVVSASNSDYTPSTLSDWNGSLDPGNVSAALDQLASRIRALEGSSGYLSSMIYNLMEE